MGAVALAALAFAAPGEPRLTNTTAFSGTSRSSPLPAVAPQIVFTSTRNGWGEIYVMGADGSKVRRLTRNRVSDQDAAVSPDGRRIAFTRVVGGASRIYVMDRRGGNQRPIRSGVYSSWSPDGSRIVFSRWGDGGLFTMPADGSSETRVPATSSADFEPDWSPDGNWFAFSRGRGVNEDATIMVMRADGSLQRGFNFDHDPCYYAERNPEWSPNGRELAFSCWARKRNGQVEFVIYRMNVSNRIVRRISPPNLFAENPSWAPSGARIAFSAGRTYDGRRDIYVIGSDGRNLRRLTRGNGENYDPAWLPGPRK